MRRFHIALCPVSFCTVAVCEQVGAEPSLALVIAGLIGLGGLALVMGMALSSLAELLALLPRPDGWVGGGARALGTHVGQSGIRRPYDGTLLGTVVVSPDRPDGFTRRLDGRAERARSR